MKQIKIEREKKTSNLNINKLPIACVSFCIWLRMTRTLKLHVSLLFNFRLFHVRRMKSWEKRSEQKEKTAKWFSSWLDNWLFLVFFEIATKMERERLRAGGTNKNLFNNQSHWKCNESHTNNYKYKRIGFLLYIKVKKAKKMERGTFYS